MGENEIKNILKNYFGNSINEIFKTNDFNLFSTEYADNGKGKNPLILFLNKNYMALGIHEYSLTPPNTPSINLNDIDLLKWEFPRIQPIENWMYMKGTKNLEIGKNTPNNLQKENVEKNNNIGLVFSGGGLRGSYQIGVWQALREIGLEDRITYISGSSIGAINASLFAIGNIDKALEIWKKLKIDADYIKIISAILLNIAIILGLAIEDGKIIPGKIPIALISLINKYFNKNKVDKSYNFFNNLLSWGYFKLPKDVMDILKSHLKKEIKKELFITKTYFDDERLFTTDGFLDSRVIIKTYESEGKVGKPKYEHFKIGQQIKDADLEASTALPIVFSPKKNIDGKIYMDGGLSDNCPIEPLLNINLKKIIVVYCQSKNELPHYLNNQDKNKIIELKPSKDYLSDDLSGTIGLKLSQESIRNKITLENLSDENIKLGFDDTYKSKVLLELCKEIKQS